MRRLTVAMVGMLVVVCCLLFEGSVMAAPAPSGRALALLPLDRLSSYQSHDWMRTAVPESLAGKLTGAAGLRVLETRVSAAAFRGAAEVAPDRTTLEQAVAAGRASGADLVLWGEFDKKGDDLTIKLSVNRVSDGKQLAAIGRAGSFEDPWPLFTDLARATLKGLQLNLGAGQEARINAPSARDRYGLTIFGRGLNDLYGVAGPVNLEAADDNLTKALRIDPTNPLMFYAAGMLELAKNRPEAAGAAFYEALKAWPDFPNAHRQMARLAEGRGQYDEAVLHLQATLAVEPSDLGVRFDLARVMSMQQKVRPALDEVTRVVDSPVPASLLAPALKLQAQLRASSGDLDGMAASFERLLKADAESREARLGLGGFYLRKKMLTEAETHFQVLARKDPRDPLPHHFLGEIALMRGDLNGAIAGFRAEGNTRPSHGSAYSYLGEVYRRAGNHRKENDAEGMAQVRSPKNPIPLNNLALLRYAEKDYNGAAILLRRAIELQPGYALLHQNLGIVFATIGQRNRALASLEVAVDLNPKLPAAHYQLGIFRVKMGDLPGAKAAFEAAVASDPALAEAFFNLGGVLEALGDKAGAIKALETYLRLSPKASDLEQVRGRIGALK